MGIKCVFDDSNPLYILSVYLPTSSHNDNEFLEYFDHLWTLYDSISVKCYVIVMGDCNGDLGNSLGDKSTREPNQSGCKLLEFGDYFNLCPVNLVGSCGGPTDTFFLIVGDIVPHLIIFLCLTVPLMKYVLLKLLICALKTHLITSLLWLN